jgi:ribosomal-protein-alanine N-acetyltransferase
VTEHLPATLSRRESDLLAERIEAHFEEHGFGLFAVSPCRTTSARGA